MSTDGELRREGRVAGALYLVVVVAGLHCLAYVPGQVGDTLEQASAHAGMFRAGIASFLVMQVAFLLLPLALYRVLGDVDRRAAIAMVALASVSVPIGLVAVTHRMEALALLGRATGSTDAMEAAYALSLQGYGHGLRIASLFWGLWLLPFGWLVLRSGRLPRVLGVLLVLGGIGYVASVTADLASIQKESIVWGALRMAAAAGEIGGGLWLLLFGARLPRSGAQ